ncbi:unnamed protein product [Soboliphyme baturini]|uniref:LAM_G_DOMAIN domain-containing protein n=1 Tax=Soboliphyme baturini TaxID=241478 RepID=A0A183I9Y7_9BILA|nr:unnamed protein product [Soboliphyme baturini]
MVFSFKTDQASALLLYAHDQFYNFIQVHLLNGNKLVLTLNSGTDIKQCTIVGRRSGFNNMHWVQVLIEQNSDSTVLKAEDLLCYIVGARTLVADYVNIFNDPDNLQSVFPPRLPVKPTDIKSYRILYVGGLPTAKTSSQNVRKKRQSLYNTVLPDFAGCLRGLAINHRRILLEANGEQNGYVSEGCDFGGEELSCLNGGYQTVNWQRKMLLQCECKHTSFTGVNCSDGKIPSHGDEVMYCDLRCVCKVSS